MPNYALKFPIDLTLPPSIKMTSVQGHYQPRTQQFLLPTFWAIHLYEYEANLKISSQHLKIKPNHIGITPPNTRTQYTWHEPSQHACAHFYLPSSKIIKRVLPTEINGATNDAINGATNNTTQLAAFADTSPVRIGALLDMGNRFEKFKQSFLEAVQWSASCQARANARLWDLLWQLTDPPAQLQTTESSAWPKPIHPQVQFAVEWIELHLSRPIRVSHLVAHVDLSHNQLTRLFKKHLNRSIINYIRQRRVNRARHLLIFSVTPIKVIAIETGFADLQAFNKTMRLVCGLSPRAIRLKYGLKS